ncbi:MAG: class I SAM-dependent methyltransferase [Azospirillaceae bacterium]|nr:class I SAM-dependent methyltransferase [Azospirillaceae bacterium]
MLRPRLRRLAFGLTTLFGVGARGYFIPYRHAGAIARPVPGHPAVAALFRTHQDGFAAVLAAIDGFTSELLALKGPAPEPRWDQDWFPRLDAAAAYAMVRTRRPQRIVEIGSGHSTRFLSRAIRDGGIACRLVAIDPAPRAIISALPITALAQTVQAAGWAPFADLMPGDIVFIDSSHILMPGSDVDLLFGEILPRLPAGILVHIHDMMLPDPYPPVWAWRGYNEQPLVAAILGGGGWKPLFASHYVATRLDHLVKRTVIDRLPLRPGAFEASLWLEKQAPALAAAGCD